MTPYAKCIIRIPQLPLSATLADTWQPLLDAIRYASPTFYQQVKDLRYEDLDSQPKTIRETMHKYLNRAKYRCTPLGRFASVGLLSTAPIAAHKVILSAGRTLHEFTDWTAIEDLTFGTAVQELQLFANSTYYQVEDDIRYIRRKGETFEMASIGYSALVIEILQYLHEPKSWQALVSSIDFSESYIQPLIDCGLIITGQAPNMIGQDYFASMGGVQPESSRKYLISELTLNDPTIPQHYFKHIPALIRLLASHAPADATSANLTDFTARFTRRFDRQNVPLMVALDPDIGVGYGDFHTAGISSIIRNLLVDKEEEKDSLAEQLSSGLNQAYSRQTIRLDALWKDAADKPAKRPLPNSLSIICTLHDGQLFVRRIGGNSFNQLAGRFTMASEGFGQLCQEIATLEAEANPGVLFFDISYNAERAVDNVNRRQQVYPYELNLLNYPGTDHILTLDDIIVSVSGTEVILRSRKLGMRLIPRMASAYNYRRSKLPVFRFLYDMSFHGIIPDLSFDPAELLKGRRYYPKVQFRNIVLSQPKIRVTPQEINMPEPAQALIAQLQDVQIFPLVRMIKGEEDTVFDLRVAVQVDLLIFEVRRSGEVWLEPLPLPEDALFQDDEGNGYTNEMVIPLVHREEIYGESTPVDSGIAEQRNFMPMEQWLYFEVYTAPTFGNTVLLQVHEQIKQYADKIDKWFFIRYNQDGPHLRFRVLFNQDTQLHFFRDVTSTLQPMLAAGTVHDIAIRTYSRELERYGVAGMDNIEAHFYLDSEIAVDLFRKGHADLDRYIHCIRIFQRVRALGSIESQRYHRWINHIRKMFETEHNLGARQYHQANRYFQQHREEINTGSQNLTLQELRLAESIHQLLMQCPDRRRAPLLTDLMHMHINRLFPDHQRTHELLTFTLLANLLKMPVPVRD